MENHLSSSKYTFIVVFDNIYSMKLIIRLTDVFKLNLSGFSNFN